MIKVHILQCGSVITDESIPDASKANVPWAYTGFMRSNKHHICVPVFAYLIEHPQGKVLIDTGWHHDVRIDQKKHMSWKLNIASKAILPDGAAIDEQLAKLDIKPKDIDIVFLTHLDVDHASGIELVKDAKHIYTSQKELEAVKKGNIRYDSALWKDVKLEPLKDHDLFHDGTIQIIDLYGHSEGMSGALINHDGKFVVLTGDACYCRKNWEQLQLQGLTVDKDKALSSIKKIHELSKDPSCIEILASHDSEKKPHVIEL